MPHNPDREPSCNCTTVGMATIKELEMALLNRKTSFIAKSRELEKAKKTLSDAQREVDRLEYDLKYLEGK